MNAYMSPANIGRMIRDARKARGWTQLELADALKTSQSAIGRIEAGHQNLSLSLINRIAVALDSPLLIPSTATTSLQSTMNLHIGGQTSLNGSIETRSSKNAAVALLCASLLNRGRTVLSGIAHIEEVNRILEVLESIGVQATWSKDGRDLTIERPERLDLELMNIEAARKTRSIIMFLGPLCHELSDFQLPYAGGCSLGARTIEPHLQALRHYGLSVLATDGFYRCNVSEISEGKRAIVLTERGDTVTENTLMAAALHPGITIIRNASPNYMVQDLCVFLSRCGVQIEGVGTTTLTVHGVREINADIRYEISEDPIETMSLLTAAIVTKSELTITRAPIEFLEIELSILTEMGLRCTLTEEYTSGNDFTRLVDITVHPSRLKAPQDKIHPMPFPGLNIDNLPFFAVIALEAEGQTTIHDWVYENRAIHLLKLEELGANIQLLDPHRLIVTGPTNWHGREMTCPPALRPAVCLMLAMLAGKSDSTLRDVYVINRGYEDLPERLNRLGARIDISRE